MHPDSQLAATLLALQAADLALRDQLLARGELHQGYHPEMEALHAHNAQVLAALIAAHGFPTRARVGAAASAAAWLVIQHAIGHPHFMRQCRDWLQEAVATEQADPIQLAHLTDRIAVLEGQPQLYGTQFDWDENGELSPNPCDDLRLVDQRRTALGLPPLAEQTARLRQQAAQEGQAPPANWKQRWQEVQDWRRKVGWME